MYCEAAGKECAYLDQIERLRQDALIEQVQASGSRLELAERVEKMASGYTNGNLHCDEDFCVALGMAVRNSILYGSVEKLKDERQ